MNKCKYCGCYLDAGEKCDCQDQIKKYEADISDSLHQTLVGQIEFNFSNMKSEEHKLKISKIKIKSLYGISEYEADGTSKEFSGTNGVGKSSIIDAIRLALTNKSNRDYIIKKGSTEGEIIIETDTGLSIDRKIRSTQADYKSVKQNGREVGSPESFLKDIFTPLQLNPIEFMNMDKKQQNAIILDMIEYDWDMNSIKEWFGEIPSWVSYDQNILSVLNDIQSEKGEYFTLRQDINRDKRNKMAFIEDIGKALPIGYNASQWENASTSDIYSKIAKIQHDNQIIEKAHSVIENKNNKIRSIEAEKEIKITAINREFSNRTQDIKDQITEYENLIKELNTEAATLESRKLDKLAIAEQEYKAKVAAFDSEVGTYAEYADKQIIDITELQNEATTIEKMKSYINEYKRMINLQDEVDTLNKKSEELTNKIEKARTLPGEILANCSIPIAGLSVDNGIPLINGLPVSNLSEGEKLDLCIDVAIQKPNGLQIILIDGVEKLSTELRNQLYQKCKDKGLQIIATRTTDEPDLTCIEL